METATLISLSFNFFLVLLLLYFDWSRRSDSRNKDEVIKDLSLKVISRTSVEYLQAKGEPPKDSEEIVDPYVDLEEVETEKLFEAKDNV